MHCPGNAQVIIPRRSKHYQLFINLKFTYEPHVKKDFKYAPFQFICYPLPGTNLQNAHLLPLTVRKALLRLASSIGN